jgi:hypothetical protein
MRISTNRSNLPIGKLSSSKVKLLALILPVMLFTLSAQVSYAQFTASITVTQEVSCQGDADGQLQAVGNNGTGSYSYLWSTTSTAEIITGLASGNYTVTITDLGTSATDVATIFLADPPDLNATIVINQQITCFNACDGEIEIVIDATDYGTPPYTYAWGTSSVTTALRQNMCAGAFSAVVNDANGCEASPSPTVTLTNPAKINIFESVSNVNCFGAADGAISISLGISGGGFSPFVYVWTGTSNPAYSNTLNGNNFAGSISGLGPGDYTLVVTDDNGCSASEPAYAVTEPAGMSTSTSPTPVTCFGYTDGGVTLTVTGNNPFTFAWSNLATTQSISGVAAGTYTVTITDSNGCTATDSETVGAANQILANETISHLVCNGEGNGQVALAPSGGTSPYAYVWSIPETTAIISALDGDTYSVTITDNVGCQFINSYVVNEPSAINIAQTIVDVLCHGESTGSITVNVSGGTPGTPAYTYAWSVAGTTNMIDNLAAGPYSVTVTDDNSCTASEAYTINEPGTGLSASINPVPLKCAGDLGAIPLDVTGGTPTYSYLWSPDSETTQTLSNKAGGPYSVVVTDGNGCTVQASGTLEEPPALTLSGVAAGLSCNATNDGSIDITVGGGGTPYVYSWTGPAFTSSSGDISGLAPGDYFLTVTDDSLCTISDDWNVSQPVAITIASPATIVDVDCHGDATGSISISASGGVAPLTYAWTGGGTSATYTGLTSAFYTVTVSDASVPACTVTETYFVAEPSTALAAEINPVPLKCFGDVATIPLDVTGGTPPYSYLWSPGGEITQTLAGKPAGVYSVVVTDDNGCPANASGELFEPTELVFFDSTKANVSCFGAGDGSIDIVIDGGGMPYVYSWTGTVTSSNQNLSTLSPGTYTIEVTDDSLCVIEKTFYITEPTEVTIGTPTITHVLCKNDATGEITASASGGVGPLTYTWSNTDVGATTSGLIAGAYTVTVSDASVPACTKTATYFILEPDFVLAAEINPVPLKCFGDVATIPLDVTGGTPPYSYLWSPGGEITQTLSGKPAGIYSVVVTDDNGCPANASGELFEPTELVFFDSTKTDISCFGAADGTISIVIDGGGTPYVYSWTGATTSSNQNLTGLGEGWYQVEVTDDSSCVIAKTFYIAEPAAITVAEDSSDYNGYGVSCNAGTNGTIDLSVSGGTGPFTFDWSDNVSFTSADQNLSGLDAATYYVTVTDDNGCTAIINTTITEPSALTLSGTEVDIDCFGDDDGEITITYGGGVPALSFAWSDGPTVTNRTGLDMGTYDLVITDANGCTIGGSWTIDEPTEITISESISDFNSYGVSCFGSNDGWISLTVTGGTPGVSPDYTYNWSNTETTQNLNNLIADVYAVTVTDDNGCTMTKSIGLSSPTPVAIAVDDVVHVDCNAAFTGLINTTASGGVAPYSYSWTGPGVFAAATDDISGLEAGDYTLVVTDANGCTATTMVTITQPLNLSITAAQVIYAGFYNVSCNGVCDGEIDLTMVGGVAPYSYSWTGPGGFTASTEDLTGLCASDTETYNVTVTDANGCTTTEIFFVLGPDELNVQVNSFPVECFGELNGTVFADVQGGAGPYTVTWYDSGNTIVGTGLSLGGLGAGEYHAVVVDANGCVSNTGDNGMLPTNWAYTNTGDNHTILIETSTLFSFGGGNINVGDYLGVFYVDQVTLMEECGGYIMWNGVNAALTAWVDDTNTADQDGFIPGTDFIWKLYRPTYGEFAATATYQGTAPYTPPFSAGPTFITGGISGLESLTTVVTTFANLDISYVEVEQPDLLTVSLSADNIQCAGMSTTIYTTVAGGNGGNMYLWSPNSETTDFITALGTPTVPMTYGVIVEDSKGCLATATIGILDPDPLVASTVTTDAHCFGANTGTAVVTTIGGYPPYTVDAGGADLNALTQGTYTVTVTDAEGCTTTDQFTINEPTELTSSVSGVNIDCNGFNTGSVDLTPSGGTPAYTYAWTGPAFSATTQDISGLYAGTYDVLITDSHGCSTTNSITLTQTDPIVITETISLYDIYNISCNGGSDGEISLAVTGGTAPYAYSWDIPASTSAVTGLIAGAYNVTVTDINLCTAVASYTLVEPDAVVATASVSSFYVVGGLLFNTTCNGFDGSVDLTVYGGVAPYTFAWSNGYTTQNISGIPAGDYSVTITDANGCMTVSNMVTLTGPGPINVTATVTSDYNGYNLRCFGDDNPVVDLIWTGGAAPYNIYWSNWNGNVVLNNPDTTFNYPSGYANPVGMPAGTYWAVVVDANGCAQLSNKFDVTEPDPFMPNEVITSPSCFGGTDGSIDLSGMTGGVTPYTFQWDVSTNWATTATVSNLNAGTYCLIVWDANNCSEGYTYDVVDLPELLITGVSTEDTDCYGTETGEINLTVTGGTSPYTYSAVSAGNSYLNQNDLVGVYAGIYSVTVTDFNGCEKVTNATVSEGPDINIGTDIYPVTCYGLGDGAIDINPDPFSIPPFTYAWTGPGGYTSTTQNIANLGPGFYTVQITDGATCQKSFTLEILEPDTIELNETYTGVTCFGGNDGGIQLNVTGGVTNPIGSYLYAWNTSNTGDAIAGKAAGFYNVTVVDNNNCEINATLEIVEPADFGFSGTVVTDVSCATGNDGEIALVIDGGTPPYSGITWTMGGVPVGSTTGLAAGVYDVTFVDANSCPGSSSFTVGQPAALSVSLTVDHISCNGLTDGSLTAVPLDGTPGYSYVWSVAGTTDQISSLSAGPYTVTVTDSNGCTGDATATIVDPALIAITTSVTHATCTLADGQINITNVIGGTVNNPSDYSYNWPTLGGSGNPVQFNLAAGFYDVIVSDLNGCTITENIEVQSSNPMTVTVAEVEPTCNGDLDGTLTATAIGTAPYTYAWNGGLPGAINSITVGAGAYDVTVTDNIGCEVIETGTLGEPAVLSVSVVATDETCAGAQDASLEAIAVGGNGGNTYAWSGLAATTAIVSGASVTPGTYTVTVSDINGCSDDANATVNAVTGITITTSTVDVECDGDTDGEVNITVSGGTPYPSAPFYDFSWGGGDITAPISTQNIVGHENGIYTVFVSDANGCPPATATDTIKAGFTFFFVSDFITDASCNLNSDGQIIVNYDSLKYSFEWFDLGPTSLKYKANSESDTITGLLAGDYVLQVTSFPLPTCTLDVNYTVNQPDPIMVTETITDVSCYKGSDGAVDIAVTGGTIAVDYTYQWTNGANIVGTSQNVSNLKAGNYKVEVTDDNGCSTAPFFTVTQPTLLQINTILEMDISCNGLTDGSVDVLASGGTPMVGPTYDYEWFNGVGGSVGTGTSISGLGPDDYTIQVEDDNGCIALAVYYITEPTSLTADAYVSANGYIECNGDTDGAVNAQVSGGTFPYTFIWSTGSTNDFIDGLSPGTYTVTVNDANGCDVSADTILINPPVLGLTLVDGGATINADVGLTPGTPGSPNPYTYDWYINSVAFNAPLSSQVTKFPGTYYECTIMDGNGCTAYDDLTTPAPPPVDSDDSEDTAEPTVLLEQLISVANEVNVYPNPNSTGVFYVDLGKVELETTQLQVIDAVGRVIDNMKLVDDMNRLIELQIPAAKGVYYLRIITEGYGSVTKQLIITE